MVIFHFIHFKVYLNSERTIQCKTSFPPPPHLPQNIPTCFPGHIYIAAARFIHGMLGSSLGYLTRGAKFYTMLQQIVVSCLPKSNYSLEEKLSSCLPTSSPFSPLNRTQSRSQYGWSHGCNGLLSPIHIYKGVCAKVIDSTHNHK